MKLHRLLFMLALLVVMPLAGADTPAGLEPAIRAQVARAGQLAEQGRLDEAARIYEGIIDARPDLLFAYNNLAVIHARQGQLEAAAQILKRGIASNPEFASLYNNLTSIYQELSRQDYGKALRLQDRPAELALETLSPPAPAPTQKADMAADTAQPPAQAADKNRDEVLLTVQGWAEAWSARDVDKYLSYYADDFVPPRGMGRQAWREQRRQRLRRPRWVQVSLSQLDITPLAGDRMQVRFLQHYRSDSYEDRTRKQLSLKKTPQGWKIVKEKSL